MICSTLDFYTEEQLDWTLLSKYNNEDSKKYGREYKKQFALLPSVDHLEDGKGPANFVICAWRTNDSKNDLSYEEFVELRVPERLLSPEVLIHIAFTNDKKWPYQAIDIKKAGVGIY
jgi:hypothetical protein